MSKRIFVKELEERTEVLKLNRDDIERVAFLDDCLWFKVSEKEIEDLQEYAEVGGLQLDEEDLEDIIFSKWDLEDLQKSKIFIELLEEHAGRKSFDEVIEEYNKYKDDDEEEFTKEDLNNILNVLKNDFSKGDEWLETTEVYNYWDGSNHKTIALSGEYTDWVEVREWEIKDFTVKEVIDTKNHGTYENKLCITENEERVIITESYMQGDISDTWEFVSDVKSLDEY